MLLVKYQKGVAQKVKSTLHLLSEGQGKVLSSRPFYVWWFMGQIAMCVNFSQKCQFVDLWMQKHVFMALRSYFYSSLGDLPRISSPNRCTDLPMAMLGWVQMTEVLVLWLIGHSSTSALPCTAWEACRCQYSSRNTSTTTSQLLPSVSPCCLSHLLSNWIYYL